MVGQEGVGDGNDAVFATVGFEFVEDVEVVERSIAVRNFLDDGTERPLTFGCHAAR